LFDFILNKKVKYNSNLESIINKLSDESEESIQFIKNYIERTNQLKILIQELSKGWPNIWNYYYNDSSSTIDERENLSRYILDYSDISSIKLIAKQSSFEAHIYSQPNFLNIIKNQKKIKKIIESLDLQFEAINFENAPEELLNFIYQNSYYSINLVMAKDIIKYFGDFNQVSFDNANYSSIKNSRCTHLITFFNDHINHYVDNLYLLIETNINEGESTLLELLNNQELSFDRKELIIQKVTTKISNLKSLKDLKIVNPLLNANKILPNWENVLFCYKNAEYKISDELLNYLNNISNAKELSKYKIPKISENNKNIYSPFGKELAQTNSFGNIAFELLVKSDPLSYSDLEFNVISKEKAIILIKSNVINPTKESFDNLKKRYEGLNIKLLEKYSSKFLIMNDIEFDTIDVGYILESKILTNRKKLDFLKNVTDNIIVSASKNLVTIAEIMIKDNKFELNEFITNSILNDKYVSTPLRLKIFNMHLTQLENSQIETIVASLGRDYSNILNKKRRIKILKTPDNNALLTFLHKNGFITSFKDNESHFRIYH
jgi:hypothetical protein